MRVFRIENNGMKNYKEVDFKMDNTEKILEDWIENTKSALFEDEDIFIIGRQVNTNLNKAIDLLALDREGNTVVIELKRDKTPRETLAQILGYASFVENLTYDKLEEITGFYLGEEGINLTEKHKKFFKLLDEEAVAFNKEQKLVIVGQEISKEVKYTSNFLNNRGLEIYCLEFKYFQTETGDRIITSDFVVKKDKTETGASGSKPKINRELFLQNVSEYIRGFFKELFALAKKYNMPIHWGSTGFSLNVNLEGNHVNILYGYSNIAVDGQSIYTAISEIRGKISNSQNIIEQYHERLNKAGIFTTAGNGIKWIINRPLSEEQERIIFDTILFIKNGIEAEGLLE